MSMMYVYVCTKYEHNMIGNFHLKVSEHRTARRVRDILLWWAQPVLKICIYRKCSILHAMAVIFKLALVPQVKYCIHRLSPPCGVSEGMNECVLYVWGFVFH